jgi:hypothetical protein
MNRRYLRHHVKFGAIILVTLFLLLAGCKDDPISGELTSDQSALPASTPQSELSTSTISPGTPADAAQPSPSTVPAQIALVIDFPSLDPYLADQNDYRVEMHASFTGENSSGEPVSWSVDGQRSVTSDPAALQLDIDVQGFTDHDGIEEITMVWIGQESYLVVPTVGCIGRPADEEDQVDPLSLANHYLTGVTGAQLKAGSMEVNGRPSHYYSFDQSARPDWLEHELTVLGHLFFAEEDGTITRIEMTASGTTQFHPQRDTETGVFSMEIVVNELDDSTPIEIPASCSIPSEYPVVDDAYEITVLDDLVSYRTKLPPYEVLSFYETEMLNDGWTSNEEAVLLDDSAFLVYEKDGRILTISLDLESDGDGLSVLISP